MPIVTCPRCRKKYDPHCDEALEVAAESPVEVSVKVVCPACGQWLRLPECEPLEAPGVPSEILREMQAQSTLVDDVHEIVATGARSFRSDPDAPSLTESPAFAAAIAAPPDRGNPFRTKTPKKKPAKAKAAPKPKPKIKRPSTLALPRKSAVAKANGATEVHLKRSLHDQVSGMMLSALWFLGFIVLLMFLVWLTSRFVWTRPPVPVMVLEDVGGGGSGASAEAGAQEFDEPAPDEAEEFKEPDPEQTLTMLTEIVATSVDLLDTAARNAGSGKGEGTGQGDGRGKGPGGPGTSDGVPAWERWEVRLSPKNLGEYAKQIDFFKIELGVAGGGSPVVDYVTNVSRAKPTVRAGDPKAETRIRFMQRTGELREADRSLADKAGVKIQGRVVFQFYPKEVYDNLLRLEHEKLATGGPNRRIKDVRRTIFGVRPQGNGYEFYVIDQELRIGA